MEKGGTADVDGGAIEEVFGGGPGYENRGAAPDKGNNGGGVKEGGPDEGGGFA